VPEFCKKIVLNLLVIVSFIMPELCSN